MQEFGFGTKMIAKIFALTGWSFRRFLQNWSLTQHLNLHEQLLAGVRFLDLRIGISGKNRRWCLHHGFVYGDLLVNQLRMVHRFLEENPSEIVVIGVSHVENSSFYDIKRLIQILKDVFGELIFGPFRGWMDIPIRLYQELNKRLIFMFSDLEFDWLAENELIWINRENQFLFNTWANADNIGQMVQFNREQVQQFKRIKVQNQRKMSFKNSDFFGDLHKKIFGDFGFYNDSFILKDTKKDEEKLKKEANEIILNKDNGKGYKDGFYLMSWTVTPNVTTISKSIWPKTKNTLSELSEGTVEAFFSFIQEMKQEIENPIMGNILIFDFINNKHTPKIIDHLLN